MHHEQSTAELQGSFVLLEHRITPGANDISGERIDAKSMAVLMLLVDAAPGVVTHAAMLSRIWPRVVVVDNVVHQAVSQLRRALGDDARAPRYIENIARRGYRLIAQVSPVEPAAAAFRSDTVATPNGWRPFLPAAEPNGAATSARGGEDDGSSPMDASRHGRLRGLWARMRRAGLHTGAPDSSILVLPFTNLGHTAQANHFDAGVHEDLLARLSRIEGLTVTSRASTVALASKAGDSTQMAAEAGVAHVLSGSIRRVRDRVRVSVQLVAMPHGSLVWAESYDRKLTDIFAVQDELAQAIAAQLRVRLDGRLRKAFAKAPTRNIEAYDLVLRARESMHLRPHDLDAHIAFLERAIALDQNYADAYGWLASVGFPIQAYGLKWENVRPRAIANIDRALSIDPDNVPALAAMAYVATRDGRSQDAGLKYLRRALTVAPGSPLAHLMYGNRACDYRERLLHWRAAYRLDPLDPAVAEARIFGLLERRRVDEAREAALRVVRHAPSNPQVVSALAMVHFAMGDSIGGLRVARRAVELSGGETSFAFDYVSRLFAMNLNAAAWRWFDAIVDAAAPRPEHVLHRRAGFLLLQHDSPRETIDELAAQLDAVPTAVGNAPATHLLRALIDARRAEASEENATKPHLDAALNAFEKLIALFPDIETPGKLARTRTFPGDVIRTLIRYLTVARRAHDSPRAERIEGHLARILDEQVAPQGTPLERALLAAELGDVRGALRAFSSALTPGAWCLPTLEFFGVLADRDAVFHHIALEPALQRLIAAERQRQRQLETSIVEEAPGLLEPPNIPAAVRRPT